MPEQQTVERVQGVIGLGKIGKQQRVVRRRRLATPVSAKLVEDFAETADTVDQAQELRPVPARAHHHVDARMLVPEHERLAAVAGKHLGEDFAGQGLVKEKRNILRVAVGGRSGRVGGGIERVRHDVAAHELGHFVLPPQWQPTQCLDHGRRLVAQHHERQVGRAAALHVRECQMHALTTRSAGFTLVQPVEQLADRVME